MNKVGSLPEKCGACSVELPLKRKCQRWLCENKVEDMAITPEIAREEMDAIGASLHLSNSLLEDSGDEFLKVLAPIASDDAEGLKRAQQSYGNSWKSRGGVGAFMMLARKWDRLENRVKRGGHGAAPYDIFGHIAADERSEGIIDDVRDLRRYLLLVEAEMIARGFHAKHRDNQ